MIQMRSQGISLVVAVLAVTFGNAALAHAQAALPRLISDRQLDQYVQNYLTLSEAQLAEVKRLHEAYQTTWSECCDAEIASFNAAWGSVFVSPDRFTGASIERAYRDACEKAERLASKLRVVNDTLFDSIEVILAENQLPDMQRVRLAHERFSYKRSRNGLRERHIDLIAMIEQMQLDDDDLHRIKDVVRHFEPVYA